jgi:tetratricopeptide (TPR) repeat protein
MQYTSLLTPVSLLHRTPQTTHTQAHRRQHKRYASHSIRGLVCLLSFSFSACASQPLPTTLFISSGQAVKQALLPEQEPAQLVASQVFARGQEALEAGRYDNAIDLFDQAVQLDATNALYYWWLGRAYGHQAEQAEAGGQFFLARQVRKNLEKAVTLNPDLIEARLDLLTYYLQAPSLLGGGIEKAQAQAVEITKRDPRKGALAWQQCHKAEEEGASLFAASH